MIGIERDIANSLNIHMFHREIKERSKMLFNDIKRLDLDSVHRNLDKIRRLNQCKAILKNRKNNCNFYIVNSMLLADSYRILMQSPVESVHYIAGARFENVMIAQKIIGFDQEYQSEYGAKAESVSSFHALRIMDEFSNKFSIHVHSHPGNGVNANHPSSTDRTYQGNLEKGGYKAIGCIFSRDGWFRFFSNNIRMYIHIVGNSKKVIKKQGAYKIV